MDNTAGTKEFKLTWVYSEPPYTRSISGDGYITISEIRRRYALLDEKMDEHLDPDSFSIRTQLFFKNNGITTYRDLLELRLLDLLQTPNLGRKSIEGIKAHLQKMGLELRP